MEGRVRKRDRHLSNAKCIVNRMKNILNGEEENKGHLRMLLRMLEEEAEGTEPEEGREEMREEILCRICLANVTYLLLAVAMCSARIASKLFELKILKGYKLGDMEVSPSVENEDAVAETKSVVKKLKDLLEAEVLEKTRIK